MKDRMDVSGLVCRSLCRFDKPGVKEELTCGGYEEIARRAAGEVIARWVAQFGREAAPRECPHDPAIERLICDGCSFRIDGCDFMAEPPEGDTPCGGYVLLSRLVEVGDPEVEKWLK